MRDFSDSIADVRRRVEDARAYLRVDAARARLAELEEALASEPDLWDDPDRARDLTTRHARAREDVELIDGLDRRVFDLHTRHPPPPGKKNETPPPGVDNRPPTPLRHLDRPPHPAPLPRARHR